MMLNWIISSSLLIVAVIILRFALRGRMSPVVGYLLWGLVLVRLLVPFSIMHVPYSAASLVESTQLSQDLERLEQVTSVEHKSDGEIIGYVKGFFNLDGTPATDAYTQIAENADAEEFARWQRSSNVKNFAENILLPIWLVGIGLVAAWFAVVNALFTRRLRRTRQRLEVDCPRPVYISTAVETPCLHGLFSPAIYVTPAVATEETALRHVLSHELSHYRHRDHIWGIFRAAALALHWYNPLVWYAATLSRRDGELCCDESAIEVLGEEQRMDYGRTLIALSCRRGGQDLLLNATTMVGGKATLRERVKVIAKKPQTKAAAVFLVAVIAIFAAVFAFAGSLPIGESYMRSSSIGTGAPAWRFHLEEDITAVYIRHSYYKDGEFLTYSESREDADRLLSLSFMPSWENVSERKLRLEEHVTYKPSFLQFASTYSFGTKQEGIWTMLLNTHFPNVDSNYGWSWLQTREPISIKKGETVILMNIAFGDAVVFGLSEGLGTNPELIPALMKEDTGYRIIFEAYFE